MKQWYIVQTFSGFEQKAAEALKDIVSKQELKEKIEDILVPTHEVTEVKRGKRIQRKKKYFPSYMLVKMEMSDEAYHLVKKTNKVAGFLGSQNKPIPITKEEVDRIMTQVQEGVDGPLSTISFEIGEQVRVAEGPFASFSGVVEEVDTERSRLKVAVSIFGRATPVELEYNQVEKL